MPADHGHKSLVVVGKLLRYTWQLHFLCFQYVVIWDGENNLNEVLLVLMSIFNETSRYKQIGFEIPAEKTYTEGKW